MNSFTIKHDGLVFSFSHYHWLFFFFFFASFWKQLHWTLFQREEKRTHQWGQRAEQHLGTEPSHTKCPQRMQLRIKSHTKSQHTLFFNTFCPKQISYHWVHLELVETAKLGKKFSLRLGHRSQEVWFPFLFFLQVYENPCCLQSVSSSSHCFKRTEQCSYIFSALNIGSRVWFIAICSISLNLETNVSKLELGKTWKYRANFSGKLNMVHSTDFSLFLFIESWNSLR